MSKRLDNVSETCNNDSIVATSPLAFSNVSQGGSCFLPPFCDRSSHIQTLKSRGLIIPNEAVIKLEQCLLLVGYYTFSNYLKHFYSVPKFQKTFKKNTNVNSILLLYQQNESLRFLLFKVLLKIETHLKAMLSEQILTVYQDAYWCYRKEFKSLKLVARALEQTKAGEYKELTTKLFYTAYPNHKDIPAWAVIPCQDLGTLCQIIYVLNKKSPNKPVAKKILIKITEQVSVKNLYDVYNGLRYLRNIVVHGGKILGETHRICPPVYNNPQEQRTLTNTLKWVVHLMHIIEPNGDFEENLNQLRNEVCATLPKDLHF